MHSEKLPFSPLSAGFPVVSYWQSFQGFGIAGWKTKQLRVYFNHLERRVNLKFAILPHSKPAQKMRFTKRSRLGKLEPYFSGH